MGGIEGDLVNDAAWKSIFFNKHDTDGDQKISLDEFKRLFKQYRVNDKVCKIKGRTPTNVEIELMYKKIMFADNEYEYYSMDQIPQITIEAWTEWARVTRNKKSLVPISFQ